VLPQNAVTEKRVPRSPTPPPVARIEVTAVAAAVVSSSAGGEVEHLGDQRARLLEEVSLQLGLRRRRAQAAQHLCRLAGSGRHECFLI